jgi:hypothetical protein
MIDLAKELKDVVAKQSIQYMAATCDLGGYGPGGHFNLARTRISQRRSTHETTKPATDGF